ncbi:MAG: hypothetical protein E7652_08905 [Ruminococcaceae bacterium]|nr:hypothetical protein [Oscillospiraceae bacterium]
MTKLLKLFSFIVVLLLLMSLFISCYKRVVPEVRIDPDEKINETEADTEGNTDVTENDVPEETVCEHVPDGQLYEIDLTHHHYTCSLCSHKIDTVHFFDAENRCVHCSAEQTVYPSGYTMLKVYDTQGNVCEEHLYDAEGKCAYVKTFKYTFSEDSDLPTQCIELMNGVETLLHSYSYDFYGNRSETVTNIYETEPETEITQ